jgi:two-component system, OmpR family, KDP operon response regulator KdpE
VKKKAAVLRVFVVDDDPLIRWSLVETLEGAGHDVVEAVDARDAIQVVTDAAPPFDIALLDFHLPDSNDLALLTRLRRRTPATRIILMTAYGTPEVVQGALDLGAYLVLNKPFEMGALSPLVTGACGARVEGVAC